MEGMRAYSLIALYMCICGGIIHLIYIMYRDMEEN